MNKKFTAFVLTGLFCFASVFNAAGALSEPEPVDDQEECTEDQEEEIFMWVNEDSELEISIILPKFNDGDINTFRRWVMQRVEYPDEAMSNGIEGTVSTSFVIEKDGSLNLIEVIKTPDQSLSDEVMGVLEMSPKWTPGTKDGIPVRVRFTLPVAFKCM